MRHHNTGRQLSRNSPHRAAMLRNMAASLLRHETIRTTVPKAKELRRVVEPLITLAKDDSVAGRRLAFGRLRDDAVVAKLFTDLGPHYKTRPGGYLRILKCGFRAGDNAPMALVQLVDRSLEGAPAAITEAPAAKKKAAKPAKKKAASKKKADGEAKAKAEKKPAKKAAAGKTTKKKVAKKTATKKKVSKKDAK